MIKKKMVKYRNLSYFLIFVLFTSFVSFIDKDVFRIKEIDSKIEIIKDQESFIEEINLQLDSLEVKLFEKEKEIQELIIQITVLKNKINEKRNTVDFHIYDTLSVDVDTRGEISKISK